MVKNKPINLAPFRHLYPFQSHYMELGASLQYHYIDEGNGAPVVAVHGNPTWSFYFRKLIKGLSSSYHIIVPDHIGCGLSEKPGSDRYAYTLKNRVDNLEEFICHLGINTGITLVGHDWGGMIAMAYALRNPGRIARIVLMNTAAFHPPHLGTQRKKLPLRLALVRNFTLLSKPAVQGLNLFAYAALYMASAKKLPQAVRAGLIAPYNSWSNRIAVFNFVRDIPMKPEDPSYALVRATDSGLSNLSHLPMLICWGLQDFVFDLAYLNEWRRRFPQAHVHAFADAGHYILEDKPREILFLIKNFLKNNPVSSCN
ncbi:alpha/beta fold hydrolase [Desulfococcaceae bacterium HSG7]|nr:alpha/beta fold hydrolase [Desulfococcaceae bacterium HSG7]